MVMVIVINSVIGGFGWVDFVWLAASTVQLQVSNYSQLSHYCSQLSDYNYRMISEEIVMVMINQMS